MNKLIKPKQIDEIIRSGVVLKSRKEYASLPIIFNHTLLTICSVRFKDKTSRCPAVVYGMCRDIANCYKYFLQANNYLNVLKYIKNNKEKFPYIYRGTESIF